MPVQPHLTPNPNARKYVLGARFDHSANYSTTRAAAENPVAARLFALEGVYNVLMAQDFITVNKHPDISWERLEPQILAILQAEFEDA